MTKNPTPSKKTPVPPSSSGRSKIEALARRLADTPLPAICLTTTFILARWWNNSDFSYPYEVLVPAGLFALLVSIIFYLYRWLLGHGLGVHIATIILAWSLYSYSHLLSTSLGRWFSELLPEKWQTELTTSVYIAGLVALAAGLVGWGVNWLIGRSERARALQPYKVLLFAIAFIFVVQLGRSLYRVIEISGPLGYRHPMPAYDEPMTERLVLPDVYYLVFDRYGNKQALKEQYNFDNSHLYDFLTEQGFQNREDSLANYPFTMSSVASSMAMDYFPQFEKEFGETSNWQGAFAYRDILNNPPIAQILAKHGYEYTQLSSAWDFTRVGIQADNQPTISFRLKVLGGNYYLSDLERDILNKSALGPWLKKGISLGSQNVLKYDLNRNPRQNFESQMSALKDIAARPDKSVPQFSFAHVLVPHDPYIFDADGSTPSYDGSRNDNGVDETIKYTNQVTYLNGRIKELISHIRTKSPEAVIVIQSDEGPYPKEFRGELSPEHYYDPANLDNPKMHQKFSTLASYFLPGVETEAEPISAQVNVFRYILNRYLGYNLPMLPDCHFSTGNKFVIYDYDDVFEKLIGQSSPAGCAKYDPLKD